ncbi:rhodanese-like domain-containing protein [Micromonospora sp. b486]|nr:rhodanese-like domain-containing protein [Micromonospora sp. b486]MDM4784648.1 rhodanese-like domain-containing protein [Micromonospora sp. b486]
MVDARDPQEFATGHLAGAVNIPADGRFAETAGSVIAPDRKVLVVAPQDREEEIVVRLARIGFDHVVGYLREPEGAFLEMAGDMARASRLTATELRDALDRPEAPVVLDVRNAGEREQGAIQGSLHIPLAELTRRLDEVPADRAVVVHCAAATAPRWRPACSATSAGRTSPTCSAATAHGRRCTPRSDPTTTSRAGDRGQPGHLPVPAGR